MNEREIKQKAEVRGRGGVGWGGAEKNGKHSVPEKPGRRMGTVEEGDDGEEGGEKGRKGGGGVCQCAAGDIR